MELEAGCAEPGAGDEEAHPLTVPVQGAEAEPFTVAGHGRAADGEAQLLTVTHEGMWIDGAEGTSTRRARLDDALLQARRQRWRARSRRAGAGYAAGKPIHASYELSEALPSGFSRSIAWATAPRPTASG